MSPPNDDVSKETTYRRRRQRRNGTNQHKENGNKDSNYGGTYDDTNDEDDETVSVHSHSKRRLRPKRKRATDPEERLLTQKIRDIETGLLNGDQCLLVDLTISEGGLLHDAHRRRVWPKLVGIDVLEIQVPPTTEEIEGHREYSQVVMDVNRSLKRFPPCITEEQRPELQDQLTRLIIRVLMKHPSLHYYQGFHDVAITFLLVVGEDLSFHILDKLSKSHFRHFMAPTMEKTSYYLEFIYPIIGHSDPELFEFLEASDLGTVFALPWVITWFGHVLSDYKDVVRLYDFFIVQPWILPIYLAAALVLHRSTEILLNCDREMSSVHSLLSRIPVKLPFEKLLRDSVELYREYPPDDIEPLVRQRIRKKEEELRHYAADSSKRFKRIQNESSWTLRSLLLISAAPIVLGIVAWKFYSHV